MASSSFCDKGLSPGEGGIHSPEMNTVHPILSQRATSKEQIPISSESMMSPHRSHSGHRLGRKLATIGAVAFIALAGLTSSAAFGANPAEEMAKMKTTGGTDPHGDSWESVQHSIEQFGHPEFMLRLFLSLSLAVGCAWLIAWHPRRAGRIDPLSDTEERKTLIILGMVGAIIAELSGSSQTLAFVIFGIGALLRFRTLLDNPKLTGKAITVVVIGLACGMGSWAMAVFVTAFSWLLVFWMDSHVVCRIRIGFEKEVDPKPVYAQVQSLLASRHCRLEKSALNKGKRRMEFFVLMPSGLDSKQLESDVRATLPTPDDFEIDIKAV